MAIETSTSNPSRTGLRTIHAFCIRTGATLASNIADLIIPPACLSCRQQIADHNALCAACWQNIQFIRRPVCDRLGLPMPFDTGGTIISAAAAANPPNYDRARAVGHFSGVLRDMILAFKYADSHNARRLFGRWLSSAGAELIGDCDIIAPVPMHPRRLLTRRFNQSAILARELARTNNRRYVPIILNRIRQTQSQVGLTSDQRRRNLAGAFALSPRQKARVKDRKILLVDDVITTGTTLNACARVLRSAGAARVDALALAIVTHDSQITL
jgi:ComF family protein